jgi:predicted RNA binding protein YcfA (HicA-like mRNA interferase family)
MSACSDPPGRLWSCSGSRSLLRAGFAEVSQRGSYVKLRSAAGRTVIVPVHRELARGTLRSILRQADLTVDALVELLE